MIDLLPRYREEILHILESQVGDCEVWVFGSRATGKSWKFSDLDLALVGRDRIEANRIERLKEALSESDLPFIVDVVDWNAVGEGFQRLIEPQRQLLKGSAR